MLFSKEKNYVSSHLANSTLPACINISTYTFDVYVLAQEFKQLFEIIRLHWAIYTSITEMINIVTDRDVAQENKWSINEWFSPASLRYSSV